jgi:hypothetical protein
MPISGPFNGPVQYHKAPRIYRRSSSHTLPNLGYQGVIPKNPDSSVYEQLRRNSGGLARRGHGKSATPGQPPTSLRQNKAPKTSSMPKSGGVSGALQAQNNPFAKHS